LKKYCFKRKKIHQNHKFLTDFLTFSQYDSQADLQRAVIHSVVVLFSHHSHAYTLTTFKMTILQIFFIKPSIIRLQSLLARSKREIFYSLSILICCLTPLSLMHLDKFTNPSVLSEDSFCSNAFSVDFSTFWVKRHHELNAKVALLTPSIKDQRLSDVPKEWEIWFHLYNEACHKANQLYKKVVFIKGNRYTSQFDSPDHTSLCFPESIHTSHYLNMYMLVQNISMNPENASELWHPFVNMILHISSTPFFINNSGKSPTSEQLKSHKSFNHTPYTKNNHVSNNTQFYRLPNIIPITGSYLFKPFLKRFFFRYPILPLLIPSQRGDNRDTFILALALDWDNPSEYPLTSIGLTFAQFLSTASWNSRDVLVLFLDSKNFYASGTPTSLSHIDSVCFHTFYFSFYPSFLQGIRAFLQNYLYDPSVQGPRKGILRSAIILRPDQFLTLDDLALNTGRQTNLYFFFLMLLNSLSYV
jgi:hypothetical protein